MIIFQFSFGDGYAGSAKIALLSSRLLKPKGHKVVLFVSKGSLTEKRGAEYGIELVTLDPSVKYKLLLDEIIKSYLHYQPDILIGHHSIDRKIGISLKRKFPQVKNIAYRHNITKSMPFIGSFIYNRYTDALIACSRGVETSLLISGIKKKKVITLHNGIPVPQDIDKISGTKIKADLPQGKIVLGLSTWFHKERKGFDILFKAFSELDNSFILLLVGIPENQKKEVLDFASEFGISADKIFMPGYVENIWDYYKAMDIFLLPSRSEGFSLALLEAAAAEVPIIASDIPGNNEFIEHMETGLLFNVDDPNDLKEKIISLNSKDALKKKIKVCAKNEVMEKYTIEKYADNLERILRDLLQ